MRPNRVRNHIRRLYHQQAGLCWYCGTNKMYLRQEVTREFYQANRHLRATFDHVVPKVAGGTYALANGVCACSYCNSQKGNTPYEEFIALHDIELTRAILKIRPQRDTLLPTLKQEKIRINKIRMKAKNSYALAWYAMHVGKTVVDLFDKFVYNGKKLESV